MILVREGAAELDNSADPFSSALYGLLFRR